MNANEMIDRYIHEVGQHLSRKNREDIQLELRSLLQDSLDEQMADSRQEPSTKMVAELLREFGSPEAIAARYRPEQVLIGTKIFPVYKLVVTITTAVVAAIHLFGVAYVLLQGETADLGQTILSSLLSFGQTIFLWLGLFTVIFAIVERVEDGALDFELNKAADWDPYQLPPVKDPDRINRLEMIVGIIFAALFIVAFNFFFDAIGFIDFTGEDRGIIPLLAAEFQQHVPWLTASWLLESLLKVVVLAQGRWQRSTRWAQVGSELFGIYVLYRILVSTAISVVPFFTVAAKGVITIVIIVASLEVLSILYRLLVGRPFSPSNLYKSRPT